MQKLGLLTNWEYLEKDEFIVCPVTRSSRVTMEVNADQSVALYYYPLDKKAKPDKTSSAVFLARFQGLDNIQFKIPIGIAIVADGPCSIRTNFGMSVDNYEATESFTRIVERKAINPDVAAVIQRANANQRALVFQMQQMSEQVKSIALANQVNNEFTIPVTENQPASPTGDAVSTPKQEPPADSGASAETVTNGGTSDETQNIE